MRGLRLKSGTKNKYGAKRIVIDNIRFDSLREGIHYEELKLLLRAKEITDLKVHPVFAINVRSDFLHAPGLHFICNVELDFSYHDKRDSRHHYVDAKGKDNPYSKLKRRLVEAIYNIKVEIVK